MFHLNSVLISNKRDLHYSKETIKKKCIHCIYGKKVSKPTPLETERSPIYIEETLDRYSADLG